jgi:UDP-N-acetylglucosamine 2-epimerase (non-hydrolysing)
MTQVTHIVGARPNFMKAAPVLDALGRLDGFSQSLIHTGQHYDISMSEVFFKQLGMPQPDFNLGVGSGSHSVQTAQIMIKLESVLSDIRSDLVLVYGDVNSTVAAAIVCSKMLIPIGHVEAGLRSFDRTMPEEINRLLTDQVADLLFTPSTDGDENLLREGVAAEKIHFVGNVMIDSLVRMLPQAEDRWNELRASLELPISARDKGYAVVTLHRPSNVDDPVNLEKIVDALEEIALTMPVIFPVHPRTRQRLRTRVQRHSTEGLRLLDPVGYLDFLALQQHAAIVITDSGGIQEETTFLGIPCLTLRENTERPVTVRVGTNKLIGKDMERLHNEVRRTLNDGNGPAGIPPLWDGHAGERIAAVIAKTF